MKKINWNIIHRSLEKWRKDLQDEKEKAGIEKDTAVTTVAQRFRHDPWAVLVSTILSLRTKDEVTLAASKRLLAMASNPEKMAKMEVQEVAALAYPTGFYRTKANNLKKIADILIKQYKGNVPTDMEALLALPNVGRKTANLVLIEAFDLPGICVDVHVHRISNRCGWLCSKTPEETENILRKILPLKYWKGLNALLVLYGQNLCRPVSPFCSRCVIVRQCKQIGVEKKR